MADTPSAIKNGDTVVYLGKLAGEAHDVDEENGRATFFFGPGAEVLCSLDDLELVE